MKSFLSTSSAVMTNINDSRLHWNGALATLTTLASGRKVTGSNTARAAVHSEVDRSDTHHGASHGVGPRAFPVEPNHTFSCATSCEWRFAVLAVEVRGAAFPVPPGAPPARGTIIVSQSVIVSVFCAKGPPVMSPQGVSRCTCTEKKSHKFEFFFNSGHFTSDFMRSHLAYLFLGSHLHAARSSSLRLLR